MLELAEAEELWSRMRRMRRSRMRVFDALMVKSTELCRRAQMELIAEDSTTFKMPLKW